MEYTLESLMPNARHIVRGPAVRRSLPVGYGVKPGERVLLAVSSFHDPLVVEALMKAIREEGARCDLYVGDDGPDGELEETDEMRVFMGNTPWGKEAQEPPAWTPKIEAFAESMGYDLLVRGIGGPTPAGPKYRYEGIPWIGREILAGGAPTYPPDVWELSQAKAWGTFWNNARGGRIRITDPEGTDITFTVPPHHFDRGSYGFTLKPFHGHLHGHHVPPYDGPEDAEGVVAGCINHFGRPFPHIKVHVEDGYIKAIEGGGKYGDAWRQLMEATEHIQYPEFPGPGLFWFFEAAIGTNPKFRRPDNLLKRSRGTVFERLRSGIIHMGFGTRPFSPSERWAAPLGHPWGHIHVHLLFATYEVTSASGEKFKVIDRGRLTALDDPEVIALAQKYGDPKELLKEEWIPAIPGISIPGDYWTEYAPDPAGWIKRREEAGLEV